MQQSAEMKNLHLRTDMLLVHSPKQHPYTEETARVVHLCRRDDDPMETWYLHEISALKPSTTRTPLTLKPTNTHATPPFPNMDVHTHTHPPPHIHRHTRILTDTRSHTHTHPHIDRHTRIPTDTRSHARTHRHTLTLTHTYTHTCVAVIPAGTINAALNATGPFASRAIILLPSSLLLCSFQHSWCLEPSSVAPGGDTRRGSSNRGAKSSLISTSVKCEGTSGTVKRGNEF